MHSSGNVRSATESYTRKGSKWSTLCNELGQRASDTGTHTQRGKQREMPWVSNVGVRQPTPITCSKTSPGVSTPMKTFHPSPLVPRSFAPTLGSRLIWGQKSPSSFYTLSQPQVWGQSDHELSMWLKTPPSHPQLDMVGEVQESSHLLFLWVKEHKSRSH